LPPVFFNALSFTYEIKNFKRKKMKNIFRVVLISFTSCFLLTACTTYKAAAQPAPSADISYQTFYDELSPYGTWIDYPSYGHVWHPGVTGEFRPYLTNGYWDYSAEGWLWETDYAWGWAPFHYGRWIYDDAYGWLWIPGYEWSPAWVTWGGFGDYYAWAPLMPEVYVGLQFNSWRPAAFYWNLCDRDHIYDRDIFNRIEKRDVVTNNISRINIINNFATTGIHKQYYSKGPELNEVQKYTSRKIETASVKEATSVKNAGHSDKEVRLYRPGVIHPQPREFRRVDNGSGPVKSENDRINNSNEQQRQHIDRLPRMKAPDRVFGGARSGTGRPSGERNRR
jgi:hypothetical protein